MADIFLPDPAFEVEDAQKLAETNLGRCMLLMTVGLQQIGYAVYDPASKYLMALKTYYFEVKRNEQQLLKIIEQFLDANKMLYKDFKEIKLSFDHPEFTLVPQELYEDKLKQQFLSFLYPGQPDQDVLCDHIVHADIINIYSTNKIIADHLKKEFDQAHIFHSETVMLNMLMQKERKTENEVFVRIQPQHITVTILSDGRLLMMQPYVIHHEMDAVYYVMNAIKQQNLSLQDIDLKLSGDIDEESPLYQKLHYDMGEASWLKRPEALSYAKEFEQYPEHYFYNLVSLALCAS